MVAIHRTDAEMQALILRSLLLLLFFTLECYMNIQETRTGLLKIINVFIKRHLIKTK